MRLTAALADFDEDVHRLAAHGLLHAGSAAGFRALLALPFAREPVLVRRLVVVAARETRDVATLRLAAGDLDPYTSACALAALQTTVVAPNRVHQLVAVQLKKKPVVARRRRYG